MERCYVAGQVCSTAPPQNTTLLHFFSLEPGLTFLTGFVNRKRRGRGDPIVVYNCGPALSVEEEEVPLLQVWIPSTQSRCSHRVCTVQLHYTTTLVNLCNAVFTALSTLHCTALHCSLSTALHCTVHCPLHCTIHFPLHCSLSTALHCTVHCPLSTALE